MAWTAVATWTTGQIVTAANLNEQIRDNMSETGPAKVTTAGDILVATGANALKRLAMGAANAILAVNSGGTDLAWTTSPTFAGLTIFATGSQAATLETLATFYKNTGIDPGVVFRSHDTEVNIAGFWNQAATTVDLTLSGINSSGVYIEGLRIAGATGNATFAGSATANSFVINNAGAGSDPTLTSNAATQALTVTGLLGIAMTPVRTLDVTGTFGTTGAAVIGGSLTAQSSLAVTANVSITGNDNTGQAALSILGGQTKTDNGAGLSVYGIHQQGILQKTASNGNLYGVYVNVGITVDATKTADRAAQLALNGVTATVNGTLTNNNTLYLGVPVNGSTAQIVGTAVAGCFLTTGGTWTDASHEMAPDGRQWKLRRPERMAGLDPLALVRAMKVHAYDLTDAWFEEEQDETVIDWEDDPETGLSVPRQRVERKRRYWQVAEHDRSNHIGYFAEELHQLNPLLCRDGLGLNPLAICAVHTLAIQRLDGTVDQHTASIDELRAENQQLKARVAELEAKVA